LRFSVAEQESATKSLALKEAVFNSLNDQLADTEGELEEIQRVYEEKMKQLETELSDANVAVAAKEDAVNMWKVEYEQIYTTLLKMTTERKQESEGIVADLKSVST
jgi:chromosome segregation ATPase